jgi:hypothetical protein
MKSRLPSSSSSSSSSLFLDGRFRVGLEICASTRKLSGGQ